jgi:hypothetical protein
MNINGWERPLFIAQNENEAKEWMRNNEEWLSTVGTIDNTKDDAYIKPGIISDPIN